MAEETKNEAAEAAAEKEEKKEVPEKFAKLVAELDKMSVLDLSEFVTTLEDHYGVSAAAPVAVAGVAAPASDSAAEASEEKSQYNIFLQSAGEKKIDVIKAVREITGLGLAESKGVVDGAPTMVKENAPKEEAEEAKTKLEAAGATVELQ